MKLLTILTSITLILVTFSSIAGGVEDTTSPKERALIGELHTVCTGSWDDAHSTYSIDADKKCVNALNGIRQRYEDDGDTDMVDLIDRFADQYGISL